ncbi:MAG: hypothetical protein ACRDP8_22730 [Actinopolymorphaceae bacterium]
MGGLLAGCGTDGDQDTASAADRRRRIRHDMGTTEIPAVPRRVVVVDCFTTLHTALMLELPVVGALTFGGGQPPFARSFARRRPKASRASAIPM